MLSADSESPPNPGALTVASLPAGEVADVTARLGRALAAADLIATTDPGRLRQLAAALDVTLTGRLVSAAESPPDRYVVELLAELRAGQDLLLVTGDGLADPEEADRSLIAAAAAAGIRVTVLPGPSAVTAALAVAGLPAERFTVEGVPPRRSDIWERRLAELAAERRTLIFVESGDRLSRTLAELAAALGASRPAVVCRALPTGDQDVRRGTLGELASQLRGDDREGATTRGDDSGTATLRSPRGDDSGGATLRSPRGDDSGGATLRSPRGDDSGGATLRSPRGSGQGDVTVVVAGAPVPDPGATAQAGPEALAAAVAQVRAQVRDGATTRDAVAAVAAQTGLRKRDLYNAAGKSGADAPARGPAGPPLG
jgi:16S rRNA (cytidine1402-2'-O)-methyltransferase